MRQMRKMDVLEKEEMKESLIWRSKVSDWTINKLLLWKTGRPKIYRYPDDKDERDERLETSKTFVILYARVGMYMGNSASDVNTNARNHAKSCIDNFCSVDSEQVDVTDEEEWTEILQPP
ncbi:hypothetical protein PV325_007353 [Microctonus aethiopoides]|nr:hypothetical protein PV325_007353 [Microctonus aethiopoides]